MGVDARMLTYETRNEGVSVEWKKSVHVPPHLHEDIEIIYVTDFLLSTIPEIADW